MPSNKMYPDNPESYLLYIYSCRENLDLNFVRHYYQAHNWLIHIILHAT
jgi:hypothetical protein